ncbi:unnamed protein product [Vicia faba]|uniref:Uncharacterized protein n=1 Tax=Vicia faba TaxID=3906 RepID=A0AAV1AMY0_VICFA|nr:unnamed protein product [Vicia faba]
MFVHAVARPLMAKIKQTTGIVGLDVVPNTREVLIGLYSKTLNEIQKVEELIEETQDELKLIGHMIEWDPWGIPDDHEIEMVENDAPIPKHVPQHRPPPLPKEFQETLEALMSQPGKTES